MVIGVNVYTWNGMCIFLHFTPSKIKNDYMAFNSYKTYPMAFDVWCKLGVNMV